jgi:hypothetical protein
MNFVYSGTLYCDRSLRVIRLICINHFFVAFSNTSTTTTCFCWISTTNYLIWRSAIANLIILIDPIDEHWWWWQSEQRFIATIQHPAGANGGLYLLTFVGCMFSITIALSAAAAAQPSSLFNTTIFANILNGHKYFLIDANAKDRRW